MWSGRDALGAGLVDALGGLARAVAILKDRAGIPAGDQVRARVARVLRMRCVAGLRRQAETLTRSAASRSGCVGRAVKAWRASSCVRRGWLGV